MTDLREIRSSLIAEPAKESASVPPPVWAEKTVQVLVGGLLLWGLWSWFSWMNQPDAPTRTQKVMATEWGAKWPYPGFSEGLLWCKAHRGSAATFIRLGGKDFGTNGIAYDMPGVLPDKGLLKRAAFPYYGIDSDAGDGAQKQLEMAKALCK